MRSGRDRPGWVPAAGGGYMSMASRTGPQVASVTCTGAYTWR
jgi:hypothetical protein